MGVEGLFIAQGLDKFTGDVEESGGDSVLNVESIWDEGLITSETVEVRVDQNRLAEVWGGELRSAPTGEAGLTSST